MVRPKNSFSRLTVWLLLGLGALAVMSEPVPRPSSFFGSVTADGSSLGAGREVSVSIDGVEFSETTTFLVDGESVFRIDVPGDIASTPEVEGGK